MCIRDRIWNVTTTMPVSKAGDFVFLYPQWVPGGHSPRNDLDKLAGWSSPPTASASPGPVTWWP